MVDRFLVSTGMWRGLGWFVTGEKRNRRFGIARGKNGDPTWLAPSLVASWLTDLLSSRPSNWITCSHNSSSRRISIEQSGKKSAYTPKMKFPVATLLLAVMATKVRAEKQTCDAKPGEMSTKHVDQHFGNLEPALLVQELFPAPSLSFFNDNFPASVPFRAQIRTSGPGTKKTTTTTVDATSF